MDDATQDMLVRLRRLEAVESMRDLISTYAQGADAGNDISILRPLYTDDAVWESPGVGRFEGADAIAQMQRRMAAERLAWTLHFMVSPQIRVADNLTEADGSWYLWQLATLVDKNKDDPGEPHWIGGFYTARFACADGAWKFSYIHLDVRIITPYDQGWVRVPKVTL